MGVLIAVSTVVGWWACTVTAQHMGVADPGAIVWDEVIAFWLVLWLVTPTTFGGQLAAFILFRYFDAAKPGPVRWADGLFKGFGWRGGWGIIFDDLVAALCTLLVIAIWRSL
jgi:phosphatidylglycerophosphatase A